MSGLGQLDANLKAQLRAYLEKVVLPIEIVASVDDSEKSQEMLVLLREIAELSAQISLRESRDDSERKPSFAISRVSGNACVRFAGIPLGHEFTSLVLALLQVGGHPPKVDSAIIDQIKSL
ncbi:MAG TPA: hypothetical protein VFM18_20815, partial [Methanosarcina sp.]|nr:hypothetical protein [Methanosarcina sp.]